MNTKKVDMLVHTFWILGYPEETYEEMQETINFAKSCGADSFTFSVLTPLSGTPIYRKVLKDNLWRDGKENQNTFGSSLVKVDGFNTTEKFVNTANMKANMLLQKRNPERFALKYGSRINNKEIFVKQT